MLRYLALAMLLLGCGRANEKKTETQTPLPAPNPPIETPNSGGGGNPLPFPLPFPIPFPIPPLPIPGGGSEPAPGDNQPPDEEAGKAVLDAINAARAKRGLSEVSFDSKLNCAAERHAKDIGPKRICGHTGTDGSSPWARAEGCGTSANGEIVACGQVTPQSAVDAWTLSPGHAAIMYDPGQKYMGGAMVENYWVVIFRK